MAFSKRVDPVATDIMGNIEESVRGEGENGPNDDELEIAEALLNGLQGVLLRGGGAMGKPTLVAICSKLKSLLQKLEKDKSAAKPQFTVLRDNTSLSLAILGTIIEDDEEGGNGFNSILNLALSGCSDPHPLVRSSRLNTLSALARYSGARMIPSYLEILQILSARLSDPEPPSVVAAIKMCGNFFKYIVMVPECEEFSISSRLFSPIASLCSYPDYDVKLVAVLAFQSIGRSHGLLKAFIPHLPVILPPIVDLATNPRGYGQLRLEAEKAAILLMGDRKLDGKVEEILVRSNVPKNIASSVAGFCRGKIAITVDAEEEEQTDFVSTV